MLQLQPLCAMSSLSSLFVPHHLADVLEVLRAIANLENMDINDIIDIANQKRKKRGGFEKKIFLEKKLINDIEKDD